MIQQTSLNSSQSIIPMSLDIPLEKSGLLSSIEKILGEAYKVFYPELSDREFAHAHGNEFSSGIMYLEGNTITASINHWLHFLMHNEKDIPEKAKLLSFFNQALDQATFIENYSKGLKKKDSTTFLAKIHTYADQIMSLKIGESFPWMGGYCGTPGHFVLLVFEKIQVHGEPEKLILRSFNTGDGNEKHPTSQDKEREKIDCISIHKNIPNSKDRLVLFLSSSLQFRRLLTPTLFPGFPCNMVAIHRNCQQFGGDPEFENIDYVTPGFAGFCSVRPLYLHLRHWIKAHGKALVQYKQVKQLYKEKTFIDFILFQDKNNFSSENSFLLAQKVLRIILRAPQKLHAQGGMSTEKYCQQVLLAKEIKSRLEAATIKIFHGEERDTIDLLQLKKSLNINVIIQQDSNLSITSIFTKIEPTVTRSLKKLGDNPIPALLKKYLELPIEKNHLLDFLKQAERIIIERIIDTRMPLGWKCHHNGLNEAITLFIATGKMICRSMTAQSTENFESLILKMTPSEANEFLDVIRDIMDKIFSIAYISHSHQPEIKKTINLHLGITTHIICCAITMLLSHAEPKLKLQEYDLLLPSLAANEELNLSILMDVTFQSYIEFLEKHQEKIKNKPLVQLGDGKIAYYGTNEKDKTIKFLIESCPSNSLSTSLTDQVRLLLFSQTTSNLGLNKKLLLLRNCLCFTSRIFKYASDNTLCKEYLKVEIKVESLTRSICIDPPTQSIHKPETPFLNSEEIKFLNLKKYIVSRANNSFDHNHLNLNERNILSYNELLANPPNESILPKDQSLALSVLFLDHYYGKYYFKELLAIFDSKKDWLSSKEMQYVFINNIFRKNGWLSILKNERPLLEGYAKLIAEQHRLALKADKIFSTLLHLELAEIFQQLIDTSTFSIAVLPHRTTGLMLLFDQVKDIKMRTVIAYHLLSTYKNSYTLSENDETLIFICMALIQNNIIEESEIPSRIIISAKITLDIHLDNIKKKLIHTPEFLQKVMHQTQKRLFAIDAQTTFCIKEDFIIDEENRFQLHLLSGRAKIQNTPSSFEISFFDSFDPNYLLINSIKKKCKTFSCDGYIFNGSSITPKEKFRIITHSDSTSDVEWKKASGAIARILTQKQIDLLKKISYTPLAIIQQWLNSDKYFQWTLQKSSHVGEDDPLSLLFTTTELEDQFLIEFKISLSKKRSSNEAENEIKNLTIHSVLDLRNGSTPGKRLQNTNTREKSGFLKTLKHFDDSILIWRNDKKEISVESYSYGLTFTVCHQEQTNQKFFSDNYPNYYLVDPSQLQGFAKKVPCLCLEKVNHHSKTLDRIMIIPFGEPMKDSTNNKLETKIHFNPNQKSSKFYVFELNEQGRPVGKNTEEHLFLSTLYLSLGFNEEYLSLAYQEYQHCRSSRLYTEAEATILKKIIQPHHNSPIQISDPSHIALRLKFFLMSLDNQLEFHANLSLTIPNFNLFSNYLRSGLHRSARHYQEGMIHSTHMILTKNELIILYSVFKKLNFERTPDILFTHINQLFAFLKLPSQNQELPVEQRSGLLASFFMSQPKSNKKSDNIDYVAPITTENRNFRDKFDLYFSYLTNKQGNFDWALLKYQWSFALFNSNNSAEYQVLNDLKLMLDYFLEKRMQGTRFNLKNDHSCQFFQSLYDLIKNEVFPNISTGALSSDSHSILHNSDFLNTYDDKQDKTSLKETPITLPPMECQSYRGEKIIPSFVMRDPISFQFKADTLWTKELNAFIKTHHRTEAPNYSLAHVNEWEKKIQNLIQEEEKLIDLNQEKQNLLKSFNLTSNDELKKIQSYSNEVMGTTHINTLEELFQLVIRGTYEDFQACNPELSKGVVDGLLVDLTRWLHHKNRIKHYRRGLKWLAEMKIMFLQSTEQAPLQYQKEHLYKKLYNELDHTENFSDIAPYDFLLIELFQHQNDIKFHAHQIQVIKQFIVNQNEQDCPSKSVQAKTGVGKSDLLIPIIGLILSRRKLVVAVTTKEQIEAFKDQMLRRLAAVHHHEVYILELPQNVDPSFGKLQRILHLLEKAVKNRGIIVATPETIQDLDNMWRESELRNIELYNAILRKIILAFHSSYLISDEFDAVAERKKEVNRSFGDPRPISNSDRRIAFNIYNNFAERISKRILLKEDYFYIANEIMNNLSIEEFLMKACVKEIKAPQTAQLFSADTLSIIMAKALRTLKTSCIDYLTNSDLQCIPPELEKIPTELKSMFTTLRGQFQTLMPLTLSLQPHKDYAFTKDGLIVPCELGQPQIHSQHGSPYEQVNYALQMAIYTDLNEKVLNDYIDFMITNEKIHLGRINDSKKLEERTLFIECLDHVPILDLESRHYPAIREKMNLSTRCKLNAVNEVVLPKINYYHARIMNDSDRFHDLFHRIYAFTATPSNRHTFHEKIETLLNPQDDLFTLSIVYHKYHMALKKGHQPISWTSHHRGVNTPSIIFVKNTLQNTFNHASADFTNRFGALVDISGLYKGLPNRVVAQAIFELASSFNKKIKGVVFTENNQLMIQEHGVIKLFSDHSLNKEEYCVYYDISHFRGLNVILKSDAMTILTIGFDLTLKEFTQGAGRPRELEFGQDLAYLVFDEIKPQLNDGKDITIDHILNFAQANEELVQREDVWKTVKKRIPNRLRKVFYDEILLNCGGDKLKIKALTSLARDNDLLVMSINGTFNEMYGGCTPKEPPSHGLLKNLEETWRKKIAEMFAKECPNELADWKLGLQEKMNRVMDTLTWPEVERMPSLVDTLSVSDLDSQVQVKMSNQVKDQMKLNEHLRNQQNIRQLGIIQETLSISIDPLTNKKQISFASSSLSDFFRQTPFLSKYAPIIPKSIHVSYNYLEMGFNNATQTGTAPIHLFKPLSRIIFMPNDRKYYLFDENDLFQIRLSAPELEINLLDIRYPLLPSAYTVDVFMLKILAGELFFEDLKHDQRFVQILQRFDNSQFSLLKEFVTLLHQGRETSLFVTGSVLWSKRATSQAVTPTTGGKVNSNM